MSFDNRIFDVNGRGDSMLLMALSLAFNQKASGARAWKQTASGLVLYWWVTEGVNAFGDSGQVLTAEQCLPGVLGWLKSAEAESIACEGWDADYDHDGFNSIGWRVFCGDWGHVDGSPYAMCAIKRVFLWHGK